MTYIAGSRINFRSKQSGSSSCALDPNVSPRPKGSTSLLPLEPLALSVTIQFIGKTNLLYLWKVIIQNDAVREHHSQKGKTFANALIWGKGLCFI